jgi:hypothetical protein
VTFIFCGLDCESFVLKALDKTMEFVKDEGTDVINP